MGVSIATTRVLMRETDGTQDITISGFGTPKAAIFIWTLAYSGNNPRDIASMSWGVTDGVTQGAVCCHSNHGVGTTSTDRASSLTHVAMSLNKSVNCSFNAWITDGVRINVIGFYEYYLTVVLFGGGDLSANVHRAIPTTSGHNVTAPGFRPDLLLTAGIGGTFPQNYSAPAVMSLGMASYNGGSPINRSVSYGSDDNEGTSDVTVTVREDAYSTQVALGAMQWRAAASDFDSRGYTSTSNANANNDQILTLALNFGGVKEVWVGTLDTPTSDGDDAQTGVGFQPNFVLMLPSVVTAVDTIDTTSAGTFGVIAFDGTREYCVTCSDEDGQATTDTQSWPTDDAVNVPTDAGATLLTGTFKSMDTDGWTLNYTDVDQLQAYKWPALAIGEEGPAGAESWTFGAC